MAEKDVGYLIKSISDKLKIKADAEFRQYDLTMAQCRVLIFLSGRGGHATQKEIEVFLNVAHPTVVGIVARMEQKGFVECSLCEDNRNKNVMLTKKARAIDTDMKKNMHESEEMLLAPLSDEERRELKRLLGTVEEHLY